MESKIYVNKKLIWDYDFKEEYDTEQFRKWYVSRVLSRGTMEDVRQIGITIIKQYFPYLNLPNHVKKFWDWYLNYVYTD